ncbi:glycoside hydrolase family 3 protein [Cordyceps fumosorosea ARSEF 2679]|uniref:beta-glucosidase n=1 Tax=Cordyceps fumosorosea (strain ARSEF 2679) TaxID=1081104 RepID=A0A166XMC5_CORFA|nr:glycoside hydrolase family 3 protein [Cordyceps fumosorosea ARSEF 2679]OAA35972.1 glycoside hydrolase family 3 protein [Cordyceps fumosorosea ARSEF 2679]
MVAIKSLALILATYGAAALVNAGMPGNDSWAEAYEKAAALVGNMTLEEKVQLTGGVEGEQNGCVGAVAPIPRLGFPGMCLSDSGNGVRASCSWNKDLAYQRGVAMGAEFRKKGANIALGPMVGPVGRTVKGGRNWEGFTVDPYLSGALVRESVIGIQEQGVMASTKHYIANEQETDRTPDEGRLAISANVDDKTMHELYLWAFQDAVKAGSATIMCAYNRINSTNACGNDRTLNGLLKTELGFQGFVVSDWGAQHSGVTDALAGLDMGMPDTEGFWGKLLVQAVNNGSVPEDRVTDMATRIIAAWYQVHQDKDFPTPGIGMPVDVLQNHTAVDARDPAATAVLLQGAVEGHVLVKNDKQTLPFNQSLQKLSIFGYSANTPPLAYPTEGDTLATWLFGQAPIWGVDVYSSVIGPLGTLWGGGESGAITPSVFVSPQDALVAKAAQAGFTLKQDLTSAKPVVDADSSACIVFGNAWSSEGYDRPGLADNYTDTMINTVADQCSRTIVVLHNAGVRLVDGFVNHPNVTAIIFAHLPGRESGSALVSLLWGDSNPSGKLVYTVAKQDEDYGPLLNPVSNISNPDPQADFTEGVYLDYKYFEKHRIEPRYEFGFGLSYTSYDYSHITIQSPSASAANEYPTGPIVSGGQADLWDHIATVTAKIGNKGSVDGAEAAQLYVRFPGMDAKQLRGFEKPYLKAGEETVVLFDLTRRDLSVWDTVAQKWKLERGRYEVYVGRSSSNLPLKTYLTI